MKHGRIKGRLQPTRGFGDGLYKQSLWLQVMPRIRSHYSVTGWNPPYTTAEPTILHHRLDPRDDFLILSSDGLFQDLSREQVVKYMSNFLASESLQRDYGNPCAYLIERALLHSSHRALGRLASGTDNVSWALNLPDNMRRKVHDDITIIVVQFDFKSSFPKDIPALPSLQVH
jgi:pyruvate dehydrogenase phosphatase